MEENGQLHDPVVLPLGKKYRFSLNRRFDGPQSRFGEESRR
jgi:hypothetical protein